MIFSRFGKILSCEVIRDKRTGDSLQYAFIEFENQKDCEQAYFKMQGVLIDDHRIHVDFSQSVSPLPVSFTKLLISQKVSKLSDTWRNSTNSKRARHGGGFGGVSGLEKKRQYRAYEGESRPSGYGMVFDRDEIRRGRGREGSYDERRRYHSRSRSPARGDRSKGASVHPNRHLERRRY